MTMGSLAEVDPGNQVTT